MPSSPLSRQPSGDYVLEHLILSYLFYCFICYGILFVPLILLLPFESVGHSSRSSMLFWLSLYYFCGTLTMFCVFLLPILYALNG
jgi:hypothetical protein